MSLGRVTVTTFLNCSDTKISFNFVLLKFCLKFEMKVLKNAKGYS